ncbi:MAG: hypothetical protein AAB578_08050, partial [Elusimicrobiota bacterium]
MLSPLWSILLAGFGLFLCQGSLHALQKPTPEEIERYRRDGTLEQRVKAALSLGNHKVTNDLTRRAAYKLRSAQQVRILAPPPAWQSGMPTTGVVKFFVLLISFSDYPGSGATASIHSKIFGEGSGDYPYESLKNYYSRSSYGLLTFQGNTLGWYNTGQPRSTVPETDSGRENLIKQAINYFDGQGHDFSQYDSNGDGKIDYFTVIWTGPRGAWSSFWWAYETAFTDLSYTIDGKRFGAYSWQD